MKLENKVFKDTDFGKTIEKIKSSPLVGVSGKDKYRIGKMIKSLSDHSEIVVEAQQKIFKEFYTQDIKDPEKWSMPQERQPEYIKQLDELFSEEFELDCNEKIKIPECLITSEDTDCLLTTGQMISVECIFDLSDFE